MQANEPFIFSIEKGLTFDQLPQAVAYLIKEVQDLKLLIQSGNNQADNVDHWYNIEELCKYLPAKPAKQTVYGWICHHTIPYHKKGKKLQFLKSEIDAWLKSEKRKTAAELHAEAIEFVNRKSRFRKNLD